MSVSASKHVKRKTDTTQQENARVEAQSLLKSLNAAQQGSVSQNVEQVSETQLDVSFTAYRSQVVQGDLTHSVTYTTDTNNSHTGISISRLWFTLKLQVLKLARRLSRPDPMTMMQKEYDKATESLKQGKKGLAQFRALVERVNTEERKHSKKIEILRAKISGYLLSGDREVAASLAIEYKESQEELKEKRRQLGQYEADYQKRLAMLRRANSKLGELKKKIQTFQKKLQLSQIEAELSELSSALDFEPLTNLGKTEAAVLHTIETNRAKARVANDLGEQ